MSKPIMDESDIADELATLRAENGCLVERLRHAAHIETALSNALERLEARLALKGATQQSIEMREIVGELRDIYRLAAYRDSNPAAKLRLAELLRRLDESQ